MASTNEISSHTIESALKSILNQKTFLNGLLAQTLNWPVLTGVTDVDDIGYEGSEPELRACELSKKI